jgi:hypothetical protein
MNYLLYGDTNTTQAQAQAQAQAQIQDQNQNLFYTLKVNENLVWDDITTYYMYLFGYVGISTSFIYLILMISQIVDGYFGISYTDGDDDEGEGDGEDVEKKEEEIPYEMKWFDEFDDAEEEGDGDDEEELTEEFVNDLSLNTVTETTPRGDVLMYYSSKLGSFVYHSSTKEIPYKYLETVARKYVIEYNCKKLYVDIRKEYEKGLNKYKETKEKEEKAAKDGKVDDTKENKKKQIFANFKTYNRKGEVHNKQKDKIYILKEQANRYSYRGKIEEYSEAKVESCLDKKVLENLGDKRSEEEKKMNDIDFASFKKMNMN